MIAGAGGELFARAVEGDPPGLELEWIAFAGEIVDGFLLGVDAEDFGDFEVAAGELLFKFGGGGVGAVVAIEIDVGVAVAPVGEGDETVAHGEVVVLGEELVIGEIEGKTGGAGGGIGKVDAAMLVVAGDDLGPDGFAVSPAKAGHVVLAGGDGKFDPAGFAALRADDADAHVRVGVAGLGVALHVDLRARGNPVGERVRGDVGVVCLEEGDGFGVGRPEEVAAHVKLFGVDPVNLAVEGVVFAAVKERVHGVARDFETDD